MDVITYGGDSETCEGEPNTLQFYSEEAGVNEIIFCDRRTATHKFFRFLDSLQRHTLHVIYVHNLDFDLPEFLWESKERLVAVAGGEFEFSRGTWRVSGVYGKPTFCRLREEKSKKQVLIVDSFLWFQTSLAKAADIVCPDFPKLKPPKNLGKVRFTPRDTKFCEYAMRDAVVGYHIGKVVQAIHAEFDIRQAVSLADMSAKIFRHHFLNYTIPQPTREVVLGAWHSYHGGKNNVVDGMAPAWHSDITSIDIKSAFPKAMHSLPAFSNEKLYKRFKLARGSRKEIPPHGVYCVSGRAAPCDWPVVFSHSFEPIEGKFTNVWIQGLELREAVRSGEVEISHLRGTYYDAERDHKAPALRGFVDHFYKLKESERDEVKRYMYKIILNSLYGKFIQTRKSQNVLFTDIDSNETADTSELVAGGMFHPFIASEITAHCRANIHRIEHAHKAIHTATDGIFTTCAKPKRIAGIPERGLGSLAVEARGPLCLLRNKCYVHYSKNGKTPSQFFKGKRIAKYALHGFQGRIYDLERMIAHGGRRYTVDRPHRLREAIKRGLPVNKFETRSYILKVGEIVVR